MCAQVSWQREYLSIVLSDEQLVLVDNLDMTETKTKAMKQVLNNLVGEDSVVILLADKNENVERSVRNIKNAMYLRANYLNVRDLLKHDKVIMPLDALEVINNWLSTSDN